MNVVFDESKERRWTTSDDVVSSSLGDEMALLDFRSNTYFTLNGTGAFIWSKLQETISLDDLCRAVAQEYAADRDDVSQDVRELMASLHERDLIVAVDA